MNNSKKHIKIFRAEKTTQNCDDYKVLMIGIMITIILMMTIPSFIKFYDYMFVERPFVQATVEVVQSIDYEKPMLLHDADANRIVDAIWVAVIYDANMQRLDSRRGNGTYTKAEDNPRLWAWEAFFEREDGTVVPNVPEQPFFVCVRYTSVTRLSRIEDESPEVCSKLFHPGLETPFIKNYQEVVP